MNRRDFFRVAVIGLAGLILPKSSTERIEMQIGDILVKIAKGEKLSEFEMQNLRLFGNQAELNNQFVTSIQDGSGTINAKNVRSIYGNFTYPPAGAALRLTRDTNTTITNSTKTDVSWENEVYDDINMWNGSSPTVITVQATGKYIVTGRTLWTASTNTGFRIATVYDTAVGISPAITTSTDYPTSTLHRNLFYDEVNLRKGQQISMMVKQFSGADATLEYARLTIRLLKVSDTEVASDG